MEHLKRRAMVRESIESVNGRDTHARGVMSRYCGRSSSNRQVNLTALRAHLPDWVSI